MTAPRFGVRIPVAGVLANPDGIVRSAQAAERLGFDSLWVHDYLIWTKQLDRLHISCGSREAVDAAAEDYPPIFYESLTNLAFLAGITSTIRLGVAVLCLPYRPAVLTAKQLANIDVLSKGRIELGIGQGAAKSTLNEEFEVLGLRRDRKIGLTRETFEAMRAIWTEDAPSFEGRHVNFGPATVYPKPAQRPYPPIWIGGSADKSLDMVADYATGWLSCWVSPEQFPVAIADLHERLQARGREPSELTIGSEIQIMLGETTQEARRAASKTMGAFEEGYAGTTGGFADGGRESDTLDEIWRSSLIGSPDDVAAELQRYVDAGCTFFELKFIYHSVDHLIEQLELFSASVAPKVRDASGSARGAGA
jgi:probable F420-dependent oxidoreductase